MLVGKLVHDLSPKLPGKLKSFVLGQRLKNLGWNPQDQYKKSIFNNNTRDNVNIPWIYLRESFKKLNCDLVTEDDPISKNADFEIHIDVKKKINNTCFSIVLDNSLIYPLNDNKNFLEKYDLFFSWRANHKKHKNFRRINIPYYFNKKNFKIYNQRSGFLIMISNNKSFPTFEPKNNLYKERINTIRWFEKFALQDFDLYGGEWNKSPKIFGKFGYIIHALENFIPLYKLNILKFKSWKGRVKSKLETLQNYKFSIVYENTDKFDNYITEKIFDCFVAGCVPVYWGPKNVYDYIPQNCFINRNKFNNHKDMYTFLKNFSEKDFFEMQNNIKNFLNSDSIKLFDAKIFSETIAKNVINYLLKEKKINDTFI